MKITQNHIEDYLESLRPEAATTVQILVKMMQEVTGCQPKLWGSIIGFGTLYYRYPTGNDGYMPILAFAMRAKQITLYLSLDVGSLPGLKNLGTYKFSKSCLYLRSLGDINLIKLKQIMKAAYQTSLKYSFVRLVDES
jgi:hypothetical protein